MDDTSIVAGTETPAQAPEPVDVRQAGSSSRGGGWFRRGVRCGIIPAVVVVVAGAFFAIGWFTSTRGDHGQLRVANGINQKMNMRERGCLRGGAGQQGTNQWQGNPNRGRGMIIPPQGQDQNQAVPTVPSQPTPQGQTTPPSQTTPQSNPQSQITQQGYLGVGVETVTPALQQQYGLSRSSGVLVASIDGSGPAFKAGIQQGDIITSIDGAQMVLREDVVGAIGKMKAGDSVSVTVDRNGQSQTIQVILAARATVSG